MPKKVNISQLAEYCHVTPGTISLVFNGKGKISQKTRERVFRAAQELHYAPQQTARKDNVAIIISDKQTLEPPSWFAQILCMSLQRVLYHAGFAPRIYDAHDMDLLLPNLHTAAISLNWTPGDQYIRMLNLKNMNIALNGFIPNSHMVCTDHAQGAWLGTEYLIRRGHRKIGYLDLMGENWGSKERLRGYKQALEVLDMEFDPRWIGDVCDETCRMIVPEKLAQLLDCGVTALFCPHEDWSIPLTWALRELKVKVPDDVSVIAGELPCINQYLDTPLTSISQNVEKLSLAALDIIKSIKQQGDTLELQRIMLPYRIIERNSVKDL